MLSCAQHGRVNKVCSFATCKMEWGSKVLKTYVMNAEWKHGNEAKTDHLSPMQGLGVKSTLRHICFHTVNRQLRDFLVSQGLYWVFLHEGA